MDEKYTYLLVDVLCIAVPLLFSFHPKLQFHKQWKFFWLPALITAVFFVTWDCIFTYYGLWSFNKRYVLGIYFLNLPLEELLFFICIPYASVFSYHCFTVLFRFGRYRKTIFGFTMALSSILLIVALSNFELFYTSVTFILLCVLLTICAWNMPRVLPAFFFCFAFILIPFFISNGVLTGSFFNREVVIYNDEFNLGFRILTIPVEDVFYGMLLLLMNIFGYELMRRKWFLCKRDQKERAYVNLT